MQNENIENQAEVVLSNCSEKITLESNIVSVRIKRRKWKNREFNCCFCCCHCCIDIVFNKFNNCQLIRHSFDICF